MKLRPVICIALSLAGLLSGCSQPSSSTTGPPPPPQITGTVYGGTVPVANATIQLYAVGTTGDGTAATPLLTQPVTSNADGTFSIVGLYSCSNATEVYLTATGGKPIADTTNTNLVLMTAIGSCASLSFTYIYINELTTVAAVSALAPYMSSYTQIGSSSSDVTALDAAFSLASELVNPATGVSPGTNVPSGYNVPTAEINTLGDIAAACVDSAGGVAGDQSACGNLFNLTMPPGAAAPTNTAAALLNLENNPSLNTNTLFETAASSSPFQPMLTAVPPSFQVRLTPEAPASYVLQINPSTLAFSGTAVGFESADQAITITNGGSASVTLSSVQVIGVNATEFVETNTCGTSLLPAASCIVSVAFEPAATGNRSAYLEVDSSTADSPQYVQLAGVGTAPSAGPVTVSASTLNFTIGGATQDITLSNEGSTPLTVKSVTENDANTGTQYNPLFVVGNNNCGTSLPAQSICTISIESTGTVTWSGSPSEPDEYTGTVTIDDDASSGAQTVALDSKNSSGALNPDDAAFSPTHVGGSTSVSLTGTTGSYYAEATFGTVVGGADPSDFAVPSGCTVLNTQGQCTFTVTFQPTISGSRTAKYFPDGGATNQYVPLSGTGVSSGPFFALNMKSVTLNDSFPNSPDPNGLNSATLILTNYGTTTFNFAGSFTAPNAAYGTMNGSTCMSLAPNASCNVVVGFNPPSVGTYSTTLVVTDTNSSNTVSIPVTVNSSYWAVIASPNSLQFGIQAVGTESAPKTFNIQDINGYPMDHPVSVTLQASSNFILTSGSSCLASATQACTLGIAFDPQATGVINEVATVKDLDSGLSGSLSLSGSAGAAGISLSPASITFAAITPGTNSAPTPIVVTNTGTLPLTISGITMVGAVSGNFTETNNCTSVPANGTCTIDVTFSPSVLGTQSASVQIVSNAASSPNLIPASGSTLGTMSSITASLSTMHWNVAGTLQDLTLSNPGTLPVTITSLQTGTSNFSVIGTGCRTVIPAQSTCTVTVQSTGLEISEGTPYTYTDTLTIVDDAANSPQTVALTSTNTNGVSGAFTGSQVVFGTVAVGNTQSIGLTESLPEDVTPTDDFSLAGADPQDFYFSDTTTSASPTITECAENGSCTFNVNFNPTASGVRSAKIVVLGVVNEGDFPSGIQYLNVTGTAQPAGPSFVLGAASFGSAFLATNNTAGTTGSVIVTNNGTATIGPTSVSITGSAASNFTATNSGCSGLVKLTTCTINLTFHATALGTYPATLRVTDTVSGISQTTPLSVTVGYSQVISSPTSLTFKNQFAGSVSTSQTLTITDQNGNPLGHAITASFPPGGPFTLPSGSTCAASATQACSLTVDFSPQATGSFVQNLTVTDATSGNVAAIEVVGTGVNPPIVSLSTNSVSFLPHTVGVTSTPMVVTIKNTGASALLVGSIQIAGTGSASFSQTNNCTNVSAGSSCSINITFAPTATGLQSASVVITSNAPSSPDTISASGTGQ